MKETKHTITTSEGKRIHKKLASKPIKFQLSRKPEERRKPTNRCRRCGNFCQGNTATPIKEYTESQEARQWRRKDPRTAKSSKLTRNWTLRNHKLPHQRTNFRKNKIPPQRKYTRRKTIHPKQIHRCLPHQFNAVPVTVRVRPRRKMNHRPHRYAKPLLLKGRRKLQNSLLNEFSFSHYQKVQNGFLVSFRNIREPKLFCPFRS